MYMYVRRCAGCWGRRQGHDRDADATATAAAGAPSAVAAGRRQGDRGPTSAGASARLAGRLGHA